MAIKSNIYIDQGASYTIDVDIINANGSIIELTGYTANAQIRKYYTSSNAISFSTNVGSGIVTLSLTANQTSNIVSGRYVYDLIVTSPMGTKTRIVEGIVTVNPSVTR